MRDRDPGPRMAAVILAGGLGRRLGGAVKANIVVGGVRLLDRAVAALGDGVQPLLVASGHIEPDVLRVPPKAIAVPDLLPGSQGPVAGLVAAVDAVRHKGPPADFILSMAVDTPFFPANFAEMALLLIEGHHAVIARFDGQEYPTNALWRFSAVAHLPEALRAGTAPSSLRRLATQIGVAWLDWPMGPGGNPFANANTPYELATLERCASVGMRN